MNKEKSITIYIDCVPEEAGTVPENLTERQYSTEDVLHLSVSPKTGFAFVNWTEGGVEFSTNPKADVKLTDTLESERTFVANFKKV